jgi:hypothetical protein
MSFKIKIVEVNIEEVRQGKNKYDKAAVVYSFNGQNRTQNIMSFSNPAIFAKVRDMKVGQEYNVEVTKNDKGYNQWAAIESVASSQASEAGAKSVPTRTNVSTYETPQERALKQLYIVRQSSISSALEYLKNKQPAGDYGTSDVLEVAQHFVDFVFNQPSKELGQESSDLMDLENDI